MRSASLLQPEPYESIADGKYCATSAAVSIAKGLAAPCFSSRKFQQLSTRDTGARRTVKQLKLDSAVASSSGRGPFAAQRSACCTPA